MSVRVVSFVANEASVYSTKRAFKYLRPIRRPVPVSHSLPQLLTFARPELCSPHSARSYILCDRVHRPCPLQIVLVSSILTDAGAWGQRGSPGFQITNAFGGVLDEKIVAEK